MCDWHYQDPVDEWEWERSFMIGDIQGGLANPFVMDCSLAARLYCNADAACDMINPVSNITLSNNFLTVFPNPTMDDFTIEINVENRTNAQLKIYDLLGQEVLQKDYQLTAGQSQLPIQHTLQKGIYWIRLWIGHEVIGQRIVVQ